MEIQEINGGASISPEQLESLMAYMDDFLDYYGPNGHFIMYPPQ